MIVGSFCSQKLFLLLLIFMRAECDIKNDKTSEKSDSILTGIKTHRYSRETENGLKIWQSYEFGTGAGNREELIVTNIYIEDEDDLSISEIKNWQYSTGLHYGILAGSRDSSLWVYLRGNKDGSLHDPVVLKSSGTISTFKVINLSNSTTNNEDVIAIVCVESGSETILNWYKLERGEFGLISSSIHSKRVERIEFFQHNGRNKLLLVNEPLQHAEAAYSSIDIYGFEFVGNLGDFWLCQRLWVSTVLGLEICSIYESTFLSIQSENTLSLYEFKDNETKEGLFTLSQNITSNGFKNALCFKSGYTEYLILSGPGSALFTFIENEFVYDEQMETLFNGETLWIQCLPVQTYREECLLLIQLKNYTILGLSWQGQGFGVTLLPAIDINNFQLSKTTIIPKYGFIFESKIVKIEASLRALSRPVHHQMEKVLQLTNSLEETFLKQEIIINETKRLIQNSYYTNPVITGFWNLSEVYTENAIISQNVSYDSFSVGSKLFTEIDVASNVTVLDEQLRNLDKKMDEIRLITNTAIPANSPEVYTNGFLLNGGLEVLGSLHVKNLTFKSLNNFTVDEIVNDFVRHDNSDVIKGSKSFPSIEVENINIIRINGVPLETVSFDIENKNYENIDFTILNQLVVNGSLNFSTINGLDWNKLMKIVVWKSQPAVIPGLTLVHGEVVADTVATSILNGLKYPGEYVLQNGTEPAEIVGEKTFADLKVANLKGIKTINGIPYQDFVTLNTEQILPNEITFENLIVDEYFQIDGRITGIEIDQEEHRLTLNDINVITADTMFTNLHVTGNIIIENTVNKKTLSDFDDIIRKSEEIAVINGHKTFLGDVNIETKLKVTSKKYNDHAIDEFATFSGEQIFPNLQKISVPVTFGTLKYKQLTDLENHLNNFVNDNESSKCSEKKLLFNVSPVLVDVGFHTLNGTISASNFAEKFSQAFENVNFENLEVEKLYASAIDPVKINGVILTDFENRRVSISKPQVLTGNYEIEYLKAGELKTQKINGMSLHDLEEFRKKFDDLSDKIWNGKMTIDTFVVNGQIQTNTINGELLTNIYAKNELRNVIVSDGFYVRDLQVHGLVNGLNLEEYVLDSVFKTDTRIVLTGEKIAKNLNCEILECQILNGSPVDTIVNSNIIQTLTGQILVKGNIVVKESFNSDGKINDIVYKDLIDRMAYLGGNTFKLHGNFRFGYDVVIENLHSDGPIQGRSFASFLDTVIIQGDDVYISGTKTFVNSVTFRQNFTIVNEYNGLDLAPFNQHAVFVDKDIHVDSELIFEEDLILAEDLLVEEYLDTKTISNVDIEELKSSAIFLDRPSYVQGTLTFTNATFESSMTVYYLNGVDMSAVIPLREDQVIFNSLSVTNVSVETLGIANVNGYELDQIFANAFMLHGNQTIIGNIIFHGNVRMLNDFDSQFINGIQALQMIPLNEDQKLTGTFEFASPLILRRNIRVFGLINDIDPATWENEAVYDIFPKKQIVSGNWFIRGNVLFEKDVLGTGLLNGIDVQKLSDELAKKKLVVDAIVTSVKMDLKSTCKDLRPLQKYAKNQIYRFKFFEYMAIMEFDVAVKSVHHLETEEGEFLLINLENCFLNTLAFNGTGFVIKSSKEDFDDVEKWSTLKYKDDVYLLTLGSGMCGRSFGNLWKFEEETLIHILDLGSITDLRKIGDYSFLVISKERLEKWSIEDVLQGLYGNSTSYFLTNKYMHFVPNAKRILLVENHYIHEFHPEHSNHTSIPNHFAGGTILSLQAGIFETEMFLYYDEGVSENNAFIFNGLSDRKIRQSIPTHKPQSFLIINFDSPIETFLTFVKNGRSLEIYEYKGIEGFVYRESIKMQIDRTFGFKLRKHSGLSKTNFVGTIYGNTLTILEAKMYGEKLDVEYLICED